MKDKTYAHRENFQFYFQSGEPGEIGMIGPEGSTGPQGQKGLYFHDVSVRI